MGARLSRRASARGMLCLGLALLAGRAAAEDPPWRVLRGEVRVVCPLTVGGSFEAKTPALEGTLAPGGSRPVLLAGEVAVELKSLSTGIGLRDEHLRDQYLEVGKGEGFDRAVLKGLQLGDLEAQATEGRTAFTGTLLLHGTRARVSGRAEIRRQGKGLRVEATFPVTLADFGIAKPQYLGVGVKAEVVVKVWLEAAADGTGEAAR
jgi:polyisoprenoid-binding protein YceI